MFSDLSDRINKRVIELEKSIVKDHLGELDPVSFEPVLTISCFLLAQHDVSCVAYLNTLNNLIVKHYSAHERKLLEILQTLSLRLQGFTDLKIPEIEICSTQSIILYLVALLFDADKPGVEENLGALLKYQGEMSGDTLLLALTALERVSQSPKFPVSNLLLQFIERKLPNFLSEQDIEAIYKARIGDQKVFYLDPEAAIETVISQSSENPELCDCEIIKDMAKYLIKHNLNDTLAHDLGVLAAILDLREEALSLLNYALSVRAALYGEESLEFKQTSEALNAIQEESTNEMNNPKEIEDEIILMPESEFLKMCIGLLEQGQLKECKERINKRLSKC